MINQYLGCSIGDTLIRTQFPSLSSPLSFSFSLSLSIYTGSLSLAGIRVSILNDIDDSHGAYILKKGSGKESDHHES